MSEFLGLLANLFAVIAGMVGAVVVAMNFIAKRKKPECGVVVCH